MFSGSVTMAQMKKAATRGIWDSFVSGFGWSN
jgi:hypothetical protein